LELTGQKATLVANLASTTSELDALGDLLDETSASLELTQEQRDQLQQQLADKLAEISELNSKLDDLLAEKGRLEAQRESLAATTESLEKDRTSLTSANMSLHDRLDAISGQLADKIAALEEAENERDRLRAQADELDAIVAALKQKVEGLNVDLADARSRADAGSAAAESRIEELESQVASGDKQVEEYLAKLKRAAELLEGMKTENQRLQGSLTQLEQRRQAELLEEVRNNRALVGLKGPLERVAIIVDASGSMRQAEAGSASDRWDEAQQIAATWLRHLNVQRCALVVFSNNVRTYPSDGTLVDLRGSRGDAEREAMLRYLQTVTRAVGPTRTTRSARRTSTIQILSSFFPTGRPAGPARGPSTRRWPSRSTRFVGGIPMFRSTRSAWETILTRTCRRSCGRWRGLRAGRFGVSRSRPVRRRGER
jgi:chromosome segregation ATPase